VRELAAQTAALVRARVLFRACARGKRVRAFGDVRVTARGRIEVGDLVFFLAGMFPSELVCHEGAEIVIGEKSGFNYGVSIEASRRISIGKRCLFGAMVRLGDTIRGASAPIVIGDDVWVAHGAIIEPGVTIGAGSVVSAGSVVTSDVPPGRLAVGNPARPVPLDVRKAPMSAR
jgi:maltose O-acetyltransferase